MTPGFVPTILGLALFSGLSAYGYFLFREPTPAKPDTMGAILTPQNAAKPVELNAPTRGEAMRQCILAFNTQKNSGIQYIGNPEDVERMLSRFADVSCNCMLRGLEKRTTTLEFVLAMAMQFSFTPREDFASFSHGSAKNRERILPFATAIGLTTKQFDAAGLKAQAAISAAGQSCMDTQG